MLVSKAEFVKSSAALKECPKPDMPEYAFIGRSNVGKSSLVNMLCMRGGLAKTSSTPGKTRLINHYRINDSWYLVDLPGYGYAKVPKSQRNDFEKRLFHYLDRRENLYCLFVLVDSRLPPQAIDMEFLNRLGEMQVPLAIVFTKTDKVSQRQLNDNAAAFRSGMLNAWEELPPCFYASSPAKLGRDEILEFIERTNKEWFSR
jgi:GTP-binding protein